MAFRKFAAFLLACALVALAWEPVQIFLKGERPILAREVPSLVNASTEPEPSIGPYGVIPAVQFARDGFEARERIVAATTMSSSYAAANPLSSPTSLRFTLPEDGERIVGVGSVLREDDLIGLLSYEDPLRDEVLFYPTSRTGGALSVFSVELRPGTATELVNGSNTPQERQVLDNLGDLSLLVGAWALRHPDLTVFFDPATSFGEDLKVPVFDKRASSQDVENEILSSEEAFNAQSYGYLTTDLLPKLWGQQRALAPRLLTDSLEEKGLFVRAAEGLKPTAEGVAYALTARAARPGSMMLEIESDGVVGAGFLQPDGDYAFLVYTEELTPLEVEIPYSGGVARYSVPLAPGEINLVVLPPTPAQ